MTQLKQDFTPISIEISYQEPAIVLVPRDDFARKTLKQILNSAPDSLVVHSGGLAVHPADYNTIIGGYLNCGGEIYQHTVWNPEGSITTTMEYRNAVKVYLDLTGVDPMVISQLRSYLWYGTQIDPTSTADNLRLIPATRCKVCDRQIIRIGAMEWQTCDECTAKCDHDYRQMVGHCHGNIAWLPCCTKCGCADPEWTPSADPAVDMFNAVANGGLHALALVHPDGSTTVIAKR